MPELVFAREEELGEVRRRLARRQPFLLHGPAGVGKTLLLKTLLPEFPQVLYCGDSTSVKGIFHALGSALVRAGDPYAAAGLGKGAKGLEHKSSVAIRGIVRDALRAASYVVVLDHAAGASQALFSSIKEAVQSAATPVVAVSRSAHMEDLGFLLNLYPDRSDRLQIRNFDPATALAFAREGAAQSGLQALNMAEFLERLVELSQGNPGAILALIEMARDPRYRSAERIKVTPLYIDFRLRWNAHA
ncbi:MAG: AAA family ATPase [Acidobacteriia bacterium]|nr:AAA family ATPase [Terriglobia bacterium]